MPTKAKDRPGVSLFEFDSGDPLSEFDATIADIRFGDFDYTKEGATEKNIALQLLVTYQFPEDEIEELRAARPKMISEEGTMLKPYGIGWNSGGKFVASEDGSKLVPVGTKNRIPGNCAAGLFLTSLINAGFPKSKVTDDITVFAGVKAHFKSDTPDNWKSWMTPDADGKLKEVLMCESILDLPGGTTKASPTTTKTKSKKKAADNGSDNADKVALVTFIEGQLEMEDLTPDDIKERIADHEEWSIKVKKAYTELVDTESFLAKGGSWTYTDGLLK